MSCAAFKYHRRYATCCNYQSVILLYYCLILAVLMVMDLSNKYIPVFFFLILSANYCNFMAFWLMLRHLPLIKGRSLRFRTKFYFIVMNLLYVGVAIMATIPGYRPVCSPMQTYPHVLTWAELLFKVNYCFHWVIYVRKEWFLQQIEEEHSDEKKELKLAEISKVKTTGTENEEPLLGAT